MKNVIIAAIILCVALPVVQGAAPAASTIEAPISVVSYNVDGQVSCFGAVVGLIAAGCASWHISSPARLSPGITGQACTFSGNPSTNCYQVTAQASLDVAALTTIAIVAAVTTSYLGCHIADVGTSSTVGFTVINSIFIAVDPGATHCAGAIQWRVQVGGVVNIAAFAHNFEFLIPLQDNLVRHCAASLWTEQTAHPGHNPGQTYPTTVGCAVATFNNVLSGTISTVISGTITATHVFTEAIEIAFTTPLEVIGDFQFTNTGNTTMNSDVGDTVENWIPLILALVLFAIAVMRPKPNYWLSGLAGALMVVCAAFCPWPPNLSGYGARLVLLGLGAWTVIAAGLDIKDWNEQRKKGENTMEE